MFQTPAIITENSCDEMNEMNSNGIGMGSLNAGSAIQEYDESLFGVLRRLKKK